MATKAARGAGAPAGQAARFGQAAVVHMTSGGDPDVLLAALDALPDGPVLDYPQAIDFALGNALSGVAILDVDTGDTLLASYARSLPFLVMVADHGDQLRITVNCSEPAPKPAVARVEAPDHLITRFGALAKLILVPESETSRSAGAGAGLDDND